MVNTNALKRGLSIHEHYQGIIKALDTNDFSHYQIPDKIKEFWPKIRKRLYHIDVMKQYHVYCHCAEESDDWIRESYKIYVSAFSDDMVAKLIRYHNDIPKYCQPQNLGDARFVWSIWFTALAEAYTIENPIVFKNIYGVLDAKAGRMKY